MKSKKIILSVALTVALAILPMGARAAVDSQRDTVTVGGCHCGGMRLETRVSDLQSAPNACEDRNHSRPCTAYYLVIPKISHCTDTWHEILEDEKHYRHIYG